MKDVHIRIIRKIIMPDPFCHIMKYVHIRILHEIIMPDPFRHSPADGLLCPPRSHQWQLFSVANTDKFESRASVSS